MILTSANTALFALHTATIGNAADEPPPAEGFTTRTLFGCTEERIERGILISNVLGLTYSGVNCVVPTNTTDWRVKLLPVRVTFMVSVAVGCACSEPLCPVITNRAVSKRKQKKRFIKEMKKMEKYVIVLFDALDSNPALDGCSCGSSRRQKDEVGTAW